MYVSTGSLIAFVFLSSIFGSGPASPSGPLPVPLGLVAVGFLFLLGGRLLRRLLLAFALGWRLGLTGGIVVRIAQQFFARHLALGELGHFQHEVDDAILNQRRPQGFHGLGILLVVVDDLLLLAR